MPNAGDSCASCFFAVTDNIGLNCRVSPPLADAAKNAIRIYVMPDYWCGSFSTTATPGSIPPPVTVADTAPITVAGQSIPPSGSYVTTFTTGQLSAIAAMASATYAEALPGMLASDTISMTMTGLPPFVTLTGCSAGAGQVLYTLQNNGSVAASPSGITATLTILRKPSGTTT